MSSALCDTLGVKDFKTQSTFTSQAGVREYFYMDKLVDTFTVNEAGGKFNFINLFYFRNCKS
ncbi:MAG: hypothetical protein MJ252_09065 [archaeon]|nr:hypothetical protein [archaeon]